MRIFLGVSAAAATGGKSTGSAAIRTSKVNLPIAEIILGRVLNI
jgi:hypothetical protein